MLQPRLRFGEFGEEWESKLLTKLVDTRTGNKNAEDNIEYGKYIFFDRSDEIKHLNTYDYQGETIVYPGEGAKFLPRYFCGKYSLHQRAYGLYNFKKINSIYLYNFLLTQSNLFVKFSVGTTAKSLRRETFSYINVPYPTKLDEQKKIGTFFSHLDHLIQLQKAKLDHLKRLKTSYLQKLLPNEDSKTPEMRFKGFEDEWESQSLTKLVDLRTGNKNAEDNIEYGKYTFFDRSDEIKHLNTYDYQGETIVYPGEGAKFLPRYFNGKYSLHQRAYGLYNFKKINSSYLYNFLLTQSNLFIRFSVGTTAKSLRRETFSYINVPYPKELEEQKCIGAFFTHLDNLIQSTNDKLTNLTQTKTAYLQKMFI